MQKFDFTDKIAIVTGAGGGIGRAASLALAGNGAKVVAVDLSEEAGNETVKQVQAQGGDAIFIKADVTKEDDIKAYVAQTVEKYGKIDIFLNNAGWEGKIIPLVEYPTEVFDNLMAINVRGVFLGLKHVLPVMIEQKSGAIVNTASGAGVLATPSMVAYGASKHAVLGMTKTAAYEAAPFGVRVNAVCPGVVNTQMMRSIENGFAKGDKAVAEAARDQYAASAPDGRYAEPEEIANLMMYLVSDLSSHIVGQQILIDGGATLV